MGDEARATNEPRDVGRLWSESFERSGLAIAIGDPCTNRIVAVNRTLAAQRGYRPEELVGQPVARLFAPDRLEAALGQIARADREGHVSFESEHVTRDGRRLPVLLDITVMRAADGQAVSRWVYAIDIRAMKDAEQALRDGSARLRATLESMNDAVCISDAEGRFLEFNAAFVTFHRFRDRAECERPVTDYPALIDLTYTDGRPVPTEAWPLSRALRGESGSGSEFRMSRRDTGESWIGSYSFAPILNGDGAIHGAVIVGRDVTDLRRAEAAVNEDRKLLADMSRLAHVAGWSHETSSGRSGWTQELPRIFDLPDDHDLGGDLGLAHFIPEHRAELMQALLSARETGTPFDLELEILSATGRRKWVHAIANAEVREGRVHSVRGTLQDITARRTAEAALAESERRLRLAQSAARVGTWEWDLTTNTNYWTEEAYVLYELAPGSCEPSYDTWLERVHPDDRDRVEREVADAVRQGSDVQMEWRVNGVDPPRWLLSRGQAVRDGQGRVARYLGIVQDVTAEKLAAEELTQSEARYRDMFLANPNPMWVFDLGTLRYLDVNEAAVRHYGYTREEFMQMTIRDIRPPSEWPLVPQAVTRAASGDSNLGVWRHRRKDGTDILVEVTARPMRHESRPAVVVLAHDVTDRVRAEEEIRALNASLEQRVAERTAQLQQANRAKTDFLANMSHELRTPLNAVIGFSQVLRDGLAGDLTDRQKGFASDIHDAGHHLLSLINDVLDLSKIEAGAQSLDLSAQDVAALLRSTLTVVRESAQSRRIRLEVDVDAGLGEMRVDDRKLRQIAFNLLSNAVKFTPDGGLIRLAARRLRRDAIGVSPDVPGRVLPVPPGDCDEFLEIAVADTGTGIPPGQLALLFEPFVQLDNTSTRRHAGTGLGLSLTRRLAELHGGTVGVESEVGRGSRFVVWLPCRPAAGTPA